MIAVSESALWAGRVVSAFVVAFTIEATARLGFPERTIVV